MSTRLAVLGGLLSGALAAAILIILLVALGPGPTPGGSPTPLLPSGLGSPPPVAATPPASTGPGPSGSPGTSPRPSASGGTTAFHIGQLAPALSVAQLGGGTIDLAALRGKPVWVNFMASWCPPCIDELPRMNGFAARYADEDLVVVAIDVREDEETVAGFVQRVGATFPVGLDLDGAAQDAWGAHALPVHYWIDREGIVREGALGGIGPDLMAESLAKILPGVEVTP